MTSIGKIWLRLPVFVRAVLADAAAAAAGTVPWARRFSRFWLWVVMSAVVGGLVEETSFGGCLQRPIEGRHGPVVAVFGTGGELRRRSRAAMAVCVSATPRTSCYVLAGRYAGHEAT